MSDQRPGIVYIVGYGRSGSTLLDRLLGQMDDCVSLGEVRNIWRRGFRQNQLCSCGETFSDCPFWRDVVTEAFGSAGPDLAHIETLRSVTYRPAGARASLDISGGVTPDLAEFHEVWASLYAAARKVSGAGTVIDSSKDPLHCYRLGDATANRAAFIHLVRDSRGAAYSRTRRKARPEIHWKRVSMGVQGSVRTARRWNRINGLVDDFSALVPTLRVRYEDLSTAPAATMKALCERLAISYRDLFNSESDSVYLPPCHSISGNPIRFDIGATPIRPDDEWRRKMNIWRKAVVTVITHRRLKAYGYHPFKTAVAGDAQEPPS